MGRILIKLQDVKPLPAIINAEVGVIINSIRSSLDILATTLAIRYGACKPDEAYFPIARSLTRFEEGKYKGAKLVKGLPKRERRKIKLLKPYPRGNYPLVALHDLDILRKHRRLIDARIVPTTIVISPDARAGEIGFPDAWNGFKNNAIIAWTGTNATQRDFYIPLQIVFNEIDLVATRPVERALRDLASLAESIVKLFDS